MTPTDPIPLTIMGIDQSLTGSGIAYARVYRSKIELIGSETIATSKSGCRRLDEIAGSIAKRASATGAIAAMEDVTRMAHSASIIPLVELFAVIKQELWRTGVKLRIQNQSTMKKFVFGKGDASKDSRYLLRVFELTGMSFDNDNEADAYGHAALLGRTLQVAYADFDPVQLPVSQQEAIFGPAEKLSGLSQAKFKKLNLIEKGVFLRASLKFIE